MAETPSGNTGFQADPSVSAGENKKYQSIGKFSSFYEQEIADFLAKEQVKVKYSYYEDTDSSFHYAHIIKSANTAYAKLRQQLNKQTHEYIRKHGIPKLFPCDGSYLSIELPIDAPPPGSEYTHLCLPFHLMADPFPTDSDSFRIVDYPPEEGAPGYALFLTGLRKGKFIPPAPLEGGYYSPKLKELDEIRARKQADFDRLEGDIKKDTERLQLYRGFLPFQLLFLPIKLLYLILRTALASLWLLPILLGAALLADTYLNKTKAGLIIMCAVFLLCAVIFVIRMVQKNEEYEIDVFSSISDFSMRRFYRKDIKRAQAAYAQNYDSYKAALEEFIASPEYRAAQAENKRLREEDLALAERWQELWQRQILHNEPKWLLK